MTVVEYILQIIFRKKACECLICRDFSITKVQLVLLGDDAMQPSTCHGIFSSHSQAESTGNLNCKKPSVYSPTGTLEMANRNTVVDVPRRK